MEYCRNQIPNAKFKGQIAEFNLQVESRIDKYSVDITLMFC